MKKFLKYIHDGIFGKKIPYPSDAETISAYQISTSSIMANKIMMETDRKMELFKEVAAHKKRYKIKERPDGRWEIFWEDAKIVTDRVVYYWKSLHGPTFGYFEEDSTFFPDFDTAEEYLFRLTNPQEVLYDACGNEIEE